MFDDEHLHEDDTDRWTSAHRRSTRRPNLRLLSDEPESSSPIWHGVKRVFGVISSVAEGSTTVRARQFLRDGGVGADARGPNAHANAVHIQRLQNDVNVLRQESWWQFAELNNRLTDLLRPSPASAEMSATAGTANQPAVPLRHGDPTSSDFVKTPAPDHSRRPLDAQTTPGPRLPKVPALRDLYSDQAAVNNISVAMGHHLPPSTPRANERRSRRTAQVHSSSSAGISRPIRPRRPRLPSVSTFAPAPPPFGSEHGSAMGSPGGLSSRAPSPQPKAPSPQPKAPSPQPKAPSPQPKATSPQPKAPSPQPKATSPQPKVPSPQPQASPTPPRAPTPPVQQQTEGPPPSTTPKPTSAQPQRTSASASAIPKNVEAGKQSRSAVVNLKNQLIRRVVDERWVVNREPTTHLLRTPSQADVQTYMTLWRRLPHNLVNTLLPPIPDQLRPNEFRFNRGRHREEGAIDPCAMWDLAMARKLVDVYLMPLLQDTVVELEGWSLKERRSQERGDLVKCVLRRVYNLHSEFDRGEDDIRARNNAQKVISGRDRLYNKRSDVAKSDPKYKHMLVMLQHIGPGGMSSDEDDGNEGSNRRIVHEHPWRHPNITIALRALDARNLAVGGRLVKVSSRGNKPFIRIVPPPGRARASTRIVNTLTAFAATVPRQLPSNFYNLRKLRSWIDSFSDEEKGMMAALEDFLDAKKEDVACLVIPLLANPE